MKKKKAPFLIQREDVPHTFLGLSPDKTPYEKAEVVVLPLSYEGTASYGTGTQKGPHAIINASRYIEWYDNEYKNELCADIIIHTHRGIHAHRKKDPRLVIDTIKQLSLTLLADKKYVCALGGEHSVSLGVIQAYAKAYPGLSVLQIDAHADLRPSYEGTPYSHASVMHQVRKVASTTHVGIRSISREEAGIIARERIPVFFAKDLQGTMTWLDNVVKTLADTVYVTIDIDGFDPSLIPTTGTPEPGGLTWYQVLALLKKVASLKRVVGFDVVELAPHKAFNAPPFTCAKLCYKMMNYMWCH